MPTQQEAELLRNFASKLKDKKAFIERFNSLSDKGKQDVIQRVRVSSESKGEIKNPPGPIKKFAQDYLREDVSPVLQGLNMATGGIPQALLRKFAPQAEEQLFQQPGSIPGLIKQGAFQLGGLSYGVPSRIGLAAGAKALPNVASGLGLKNAPGAIAKFRNLENLKDIGRMGIQGAAIGGGTITDIKGDIGQQAVQQGVQGFMGAATNVAFGSGMKILGGKAPGLKSTKEVPGGIKKAMTAKVKLEDRGTPFAWIKPKVKVSVKLTRKISDTKAAAKESKLGIRQQGDVSKQSELNRLDTINQTNQELSKNIDDNIHVLNSRLHNKTIDSAEQIQKDLVSFNKGLSESYGSTFDDIAQSFDEGVSKFTREETDDLLSTTLHEMEENGMSDGRSYGLVKKLLNKYGMKVDKDGNLLSNPDEIINFKEINNAIRSINSKFSAGFKGTGKKDASDAGGLLLKRNFSDSLIQKDPNLAKQYGDLQQDYHKAVEIMKEGFKVFKPRKGEIGTRQGIRMLETAIKDPNGPEAKLILGLQQDRTVGGKTIKGITNVIDDLSGVSSELSKLKSIKIKPETSSRLPKINLDVAEKQAQIDRITNMRVQRLEALRRRAQDIEGSPILLERIKNVVENSIIGGVAASAAIKASGVNRD